MKKCVKCGAELKDDLKFCTKCGHKIENEETIIKKKENIEKVKNTGKKAYIISTIRYVIAILIILIALILIFDNEDGGNIYDGIFFIIIAFSIMPFTYKHLREKMKKGSLISLQIGLPIFLFIFLLFSSIILFPPEVEIEETNKQETVNIENKEENNKVETVAKETTKDNKKETDIQVIENNVEEKLKFTIKDGETEEYAKIDYFDGKPYTRYYIPNGEYRVKALSKRSGFFVESKEIILNSDGYNEPAYTIKKVDLQSIGDTDIITITDDLCISLIINSNIEFEQI